jgi:NitT/TauT family transport system permease protein
MSTNRFRSALVWLIGVYVVWEAAAWSLVAMHDPMAAVKLPYFHDVVGTFIANAGALTEAAAVTFGQAAFGFALGALVGYALAVLMSVSRTAERIAYPYLILSQMIPVLGLAPIIFNLFRDMDASRVVIAAYITFFPVAANTLSGFRAVETDKKQLLHSYAAGRPTTYAKLLVPFSLPYLFAGLKIAAPLSVTASILVDMLGSKNGIGVKLIYALYGGQSDVFWAAVLTSAAMGIVSYLIIAAAEKLLVPWRKAV